MQAEREQKLNTTTHEAEISASEASQISFYGRVKDKFGDIADWVTNQKLAIAASVMFVPAVSVACGGGSSNSPRTPEGGVLGAETTPVAGQSVEAQPSVAALSPTAKPEVPTIAPTATAEAGLSQAEISQVMSNVHELITSALSQNSVTDAQLSGAGGDSRYLDPNYTAAAIANCDITKYGQPFEAINLSRMVEPSDKDYSDLFLINCVQPAEISKTLFEASGDARFKQANDAWKQYNHQVFEEVRAHDPRIDESAWQDVLALYYLPQ